MWIGGEQEKAASVGLDYRPKRVDNAYIEQWLLYESYPPLVEFSSNHMYQSSSHNASTQQCFLPLLSPVQLLER